MPPDGRATLVKGYAGQWELQGIVHYCNSHEYRQPILIYGRKMRDKKGNLVITGRT